MSNRTEVTRRTDPTVSATTSWVPRIRYFKGFEELLKSSGIDLAHEGVQLRCDIAFASAYSLGQMLLTPRRVVLLGCQGTRLRLVDIPEQAISSIFLDEGADPLMGVRFATARGMAELRFRARAALSLHADPEPGPAAVRLVLESAVPILVSIGDNGSHTRAIFERMRAALEQAPVRESSGPHMGPGRGWLAGWPSPT